MDDLHAHPVASATNVRVVGVAEAQRYACAVDDVNRAYFDADAAREQGLEGMMVHPTFLGCLFVRAVPRGAIDGDGRIRPPATASDDADRERRQVLFGGEEWEFQRPVVVGEVVSATASEPSVVDKVGSSGPMRVAVHETTFFDARGHKVARSRRTFIFR